MSALTTGERRSAISERGDDLYETPEEATRALMAVEALPQIIWEPSAGRGAIVRVLEGAGHSVIASDLIDYGIPGHSIGRDFLMEYVGEPQAQAIVTNPPFKIAAEYIERAISLAPKVCCLLRLAFLEGGALNNAAGRARRYVMDECPPARVHVFSRRLPMMHRDGWEGPKTNSATAFAWFVWERPHDRPIELRRVDWKAVS